MGLDQTLSAKRYIPKGTWGQNNQFEESEKYQKLADLVGIPKSSSIHGAEVGFPIGQWRKANAIHKWFVDTVQDKEDDCGEYYVPRENLEMLQNVIRIVVDSNRTRSENGFLLAEEVLPTTDGFFFGSTEYDNYYFETLEDTLQILDTALNDKELEHCDFYYSSSW